MIILGIETSCDDTAISVAKETAGRIEILASVVSSQTKIHACWGGVVPNLAAREHLQNFLPVLELAMREAGIASPKQIDLIAVTHGPGLIPALMIGTDAARTLAYLWKKPLIGIHHIEGHIYANFISDKTSGISNFKFQISNFPILCLVVSGGHTQLVLMRDHFKYEIIGETLDDAVGEAFDKVARILGLGYPGGPAIAAAAAKLPISPGRAGTFQFPNNFKNSSAAADKIQNSIALPRPMINKNNFDFSFSGLKTAVLYKVKELQKIDKNILATKDQILNAICHEFQQAAIDVLVAKTLKAAHKYNPGTIMLAGGVSANQELRRQMDVVIRKNLPNTKYQMPDARYSIDNAAMIAIAGYYRWQTMTVPQKKHAASAWKNLQATANLKLP